MAGWEVLDTGGHVQISVKNMKIKGGLYLAVGVSDDAICIYQKPYISTDWSFMEEELQGWLINSEKDMQKFLNESTTLLTPEQQDEIVKEFHRIANKSKK